MESMKELSLDEMAGVFGGTGGYSKKPRPKDGCGIYRIQHGDTLTTITRRFNTTEKKLQELNPVLTNPNLIVAGCWLYVPA